MPQETFVSSYGWLMGPGDKLQTDDYITPTRVKSWSDTSLIRITDTDKQLRYGQWVAQLLQSALGVDLVPLYYEPGHEQWPITLRDDVIGRLDAYFDRTQA